MSVRYVLAPQAALDLFEIWNYIKEQTSITMADRVEATVRERIAFLAGTPGAGHRRTDLTDQDVKFFPVYSYLIVYRPETRPLQIIHGRRDAGQLLRGRL
jgi:plasmid stabilization system protein ParE